MDCGRGAQAALLAMRSWVHGYLDAHMGREWRKKRRGFSCMLFSRPMVAGDRSRTGFGMVG